MFTFCAGLMGGLHAAKAQTTAPAQDVFATRIHPLLMERCGECHGESRQKGDLAMHTPEAMAAGGSSGPLLIAGKPEASELIRRLRLPLDDMEHMPPRNKPQLTQEQIAAIEAWIAGGAASAPVMAAATAPAGRETASANTAARPPAEAAEKAPPADAAALAALRARLVHVGRVAADSNLLRVDFAATAAAVTDADAIQLLEPVLPQLRSVSLARCAIGDKTTQLLARAPRLAHLDLRGTQVTDAGVTAFSRSACLGELVLVQVRLTDAVVDHLASMRGLRRVFLWKAGLSPEAVARLRERCSTLCVEAGDSPPAAIREVEPDFKLSGDAPPPPSKRAPAAASQPALVAVAPPSQAAGVLRPVNAACPVSGKPVDPRYLVVHGGRVIGFCCPNCPSQFWSKPAEFEGKLSSVGPVGQAGK